MNALSSTSILLLGVLAHPAAAQPYLPTPTLPEEVASQGAEPPGDSPPAAVAEELLALEGSLAELASELEAAQAVVPRSREELERHAYGELVRTGAAPVVAHPTGALFAFGELVPELVCAPDRACDLELEAGERVDGLALGASDRWEVTQFFEGSGENLTPHILLKPSEFGLATNLVVVTDRRTYHLDLTSIAEDGKDPAFHHHVSFWYPQRWAQRFRSQRQAAEPAEEPEPEPVAFDPATLEFGYRIEVPDRRKRRLPWRPEAIYSDGERTFVKLPPGARPLPALVGRDPDGSAFPLNEILRDDTFIIPSLPEVLELLSGSGKKARRLTIERIPTPSKAVLP